MVLLLPIGAFYVINYTGPDPDTYSKKLSWRSYDPSSNTTTNGGSEPIVENGDLVAWGGKKWSVIGTVNTDTIAQDLQNVTTRNNFTNRGMF